VGASLHAALHGEPLPGGAATDAPDLPSLTP
jgi:hypothetical protein